MGYVALVATAIVVVVVDQWTKWLVEHRLAHRSVAIGRWVRLTLVHNLRGTFFALSASIAAAICLASLVGVGTLIAASKPSVLQLAGIGCAVGGAIGNLWDRFRRNLVVDFIEIGRWPTFNVADIALCLGVALTVVGLW